MILKLKYIIKKVIIKPYREYKYKNKIKKKINQVQRNHDRALLDIKRKDSIKVVFILIHKAVWKYEGVYKFMSGDDRFEPVVVICPYLKSENDVMHRDMNEAYEYFKARGYNVKNSYDSNKEKWMDVKKEINPDIVFFTNPWNLTRSEYYIDNFLDTLTCYVPYFFVVNNKTVANYGNEFHSLIWKVFCETEFHKKLATDNSYNNGDNVIISGYPALDKYFDKSYMIKDPWKIKNEDIKRIIWAPHHTIEGQGSGLDYSNFQEYHKIMLQLAKKYKNEIQIAFKPHPILKTKLYTDINWGRYITDKYYNSWKTLENGQLNEGEYVDLFLSSDALIHDCSSFMVEYLCTGKPYLFTIKDENVINRMNAFGESVYGLHYHAYNKSDIDDFIQSVILNGDDKKKEERFQFLHKYITSIQKKSASKSIYNYLINNLQ